MTNKKYILNSVALDGKKKGESVTKASEVKENQLTTVDSSAKGNQSETGKVSYYLIVIATLLTYGTCSRSDRLRASARCTSNQVALIVRFDMILIECFTWRNWHFSNTDFFVSFVFIGDLLCDKIRMDFIKKN